MHASGRSKRLQRLNLEVVVFGVIAASATWSQSEAAPLTFNTALPVAQGEFVVRAQIVVAESGNDPSPADRDLRKRAFVSVLGYGISSKLAVFGVLPYADNDLEVTVAGQRRNRSASGLGDFTLFARYTVYQDNRPGRNFRIAPFAGVKAPTGKDDKSDSLGRLPPSLQPGSGSWDAFGGVVATYQTLQYQLDGQVSYRVNSEANDFEAGDVTRLDGSLQYRLWPRTLGRGVPAFLYGLFEANLIHKGKNRVSGRKNPDSGGTTLFLTPGLQYVTKRWIVEGGVQLPVVQDLNGDALENDYVARAGFRFNF